MGTNTPRPMPDDFPTRGPTFSLAEAKQHYHCNDNTVARWHREAGTAPRRRVSGGGRRPDEIPAWFAEIARQPLRVIQEERGVSRHTAARWRKRLGIVVPRFCITAVEQRVKPAPARRVTGVGSVRPAARRTGAKEPVGRVPQRDDSRAARAADELKRAGYSPVYRVSTANPKDKSGDWFVGSRRMSAADMIELSFERTSGRTTSFTYSGAPA